LTNGGPNSDFKNNSKYIDLGLQFAVAIALCVFAGYYLDNKINTLPLFTIIGIILGATTGLLNIYRTVYPSKKRED
jgi:F0F1-type ATP synthase assembly protein I